MQLRKCTKGYGEKIYILAIINHSLWFCPVPDKVQFQLQEYFTTIRRHTVSRNHLLYFLGKGTIYYIQKEGFSKNQ
jgi:hypothetical protein